MTTTLTQPTIPGFAGDVEQFATEHGIINAIVAIHEVTQRIFDQARDIRVELYVDHEDPSWISVYFVIEDWPLPYEATQAIDKSWFRETQPLIPPDWAWRMGHRIEWRA